MNLLRKALISSGIVVSAAMVLTVTAPRTVHALGGIGAALVRITNTAEAPAIVEDVPHSASHLVTLLGFVASTSYNDPLIQLLPDGTINNFFSVPAGQSLVITDVDITPPSSAPSGFSLFNASNGYYGTWTTTGIGMAHFEYSSGTVVPSGTVLYVGGTVVSTAVTIHGYLTAN
jgi:hypothetical protein